MMQTLQGRRWHHEEFAERQAHAARLARRIDRGLSRSFVQIVNKYGRNRETELMARYLITNNPLGSVSAAPIGLSLYSHGRLPLGGVRVKQIQSLRKIIAKAMELGGE